MLENNFLTKLLDGQKVEWKSLGEVVMLRRGRVMSKSYLTANSGNYPVYSSQTANNGMIGKINSFDFDGEFISWTTDGANAGTAFYRTGKFSITNVCGLITINDEASLDYKFLFYWLSIEAKKHVYSGMGNPKLMSHQVEKIPVPIPCPENRAKSLEIQQKIVTILDKFTQLTTELAAELQNRKKQYSYYRDKLLTFNDDEVEWKKLSWIGEVRMCKRILKNQTSDVGDIPFFKIGTFGKIPNSYISRNVFEEYREKYSYPKVGEVLISASGTIGRAVIFDGEEAYFQDSNIVWIENNEKKVLN
ncbi:restriction endonuclease subunit S, partial [Flavobacteriaceae bacterium]|nr:restriction endonuclease subunit S [Flavobacteriaceae bacterium]